MISAASGSGTNCDPKDVARTAKDYVIEKEKKIIRRTPEHSEQTFPSKIKAPLAQHAD